MLLIHKGQPEDCRSVLRKLNEFELKFLSAFLSAMIGRCCFVELCFIEILQNISLNTLYLVKRNHYGQCCPVYICVGKKPIKFDRVATL